MFLVIGILTLDVRSQSSQVSQLSYSCHNKKVCSIHVRLKVYVHAYVILTTMDRSLCQNLKATHFGKSAMCSHSGRLGPGHRIVVVYRQVVSTVPWYRMYRTGEGGVVVIPVLLNK